MTERFLEFLNTHWRCVDCFSGRPPVIDLQIRCSTCGAVFPFAGQIPVLIRRDNPLFSRSSYMGVSATEPTSRWRSILPSPSVNLSRRKVLSAVRERLDAGPPAVILVVGGGRQRSEVEASINAGRRHLLVAFDVGRHADVDAFADAHHLPLDNECVDCVITTAVLEHVTDPAAVVAEISRVLKRDGLLYSEIPFMQQVHEGAYDFTRFTLGGHRLLLKDFEEIRGGAVAGPFTALVWSLEHAAASLFPRWIRTPIRAGTRLAVFWLKYFDYVTRDHPAAIDASSCTFVFARKTGESLTPAAVVARYGK